MFLPFVSIPLIIKKHKKIICHQKFTAMFGCKKKVEGKKVKGMIIERKESE
jgi:hypothetical protein